MPRAKKVNKTQTKKKTQKTARKKRVKRPKKEVKTEKKLGKATKKIAEKYYQGVGRRKTAVARVRLFTQGEKILTINNKSLNDYFPLSNLQKIVEAPLELADCLNKFRIQVLVKGGGFNAQAEAIRHGIARALLSVDKDFRKKLKKAGFLTRDSRMRERKKFGLKRARRAPQWQKR